MATVRNLSGSSVLDHSFDNNQFDITPSDTDFLRVPIQGLFVGVAGDVSYVNAQGETITQNFDAGGPYFIGGIARVLATGTTATGLVGLANKALR